MGENDWLAERFEEQRSHLRAVAYRMLGSLTEADDAVQDVWVRVSRAPVSEVENLGGWLTTIVARVCLNMLRSRNIRREESLEARLPDPVISPDGELRPEEEVLLADSVGLALQVVLDALAPAERLAFVLHDMFDLPFEEIAPMVGRSPAAGQTAGEQGTAPSQGCRSPCTGPRSRSSTRRGRRLLPGGPQRRVRCPGRLTPSRRRAASRLRPEASGGIHGRPRRGRSRQASAPGRQSGGRDLPRVGERCGRRRHHDGWAASRRDGLYRRHSASGNGGIHLAVLRCRGRPSVRLRVATTGRWDVRPAMLTPVARRASRR